MDPLNTLWLAPVGSAMVGRSCFGTKQGSRDNVMGARCAGRHAGLI